MKKFTVFRKTFEVYRFEVEADDEDEAMEVALHIALNHKYKDESGEEDPVVIEREIECL